MVSRILLCGPRPSARPGLAARIAPDRTALKTTMPDDDLTLPQKDLRNGYLELADAWENEVALWADCGRVDVTRTTFSPRFDAATGLTVDPGSAEHSAMSPRLRFDAATLRFTDLGGPK